MANTDHCHLLNPFMINQSPFRVKVGILLHISTAQTDYFNTNSVGVLICKVIICEETLQKHRVANTMCTMQASEEDF